MSDKSVLINQIYQRLEEITKKDNDNYQIEDSFKRLLNQLETIASNGEKENNKVQSIISTPPPPPPPPPLLPNLIKKKPLNNDKKCENNIPKSSPIFIPPPPPPPILINKKVPQCDKKIDPESYTSTSNVPDPPSNNNLKPISWIKIDEKSPRRGSTIWDTNSIVNTELSNKIDFAKIEEYFKIDNTIKNDLLKGINKINNNISKEENNYSDIISHKNEKVKKIKLLGDKKIMNLDIFLRQFKSDKLLGYIDNKEGWNIGLERLRILQSYLPDESEIKLLTEYTGPEVVLSKAEIFLKSLVSMENYKQKILEMVFSEFLTISMNEVPSQLQCVINATKEILQSKILQQILVTALEVGNYLNRGKMYGNATGIRLKGIERFGDFKTVKNDKNFIEVLEEVTRNFIENKDILKYFPELDKVQMVRLEIIQNEFNELQKLMNILKNVEKNGYKCNEELINKGELFFKQIKDIYENIELKKRQLCDYFQETPKEFNLESAFKIVFNFVKLFHTAQRKSNQIGDDKIKKDSVSEKVAQFNKTNNYGNNFYKENVISSLPSSPFLDDNQNKDNGNELEKILKKRRNNNYLVKSKNFVSDRLSNVSNLEDFLNESLKDDRNPLSIKNNNDTILKQETEIINEGSIKCNREVQISPSQSESSLSYDSSKNSDDDREDDKKSNLKKNTIVTISRDDGFESDNKNDKQNIVENPVKKEKVITSKNNHSTTNVEKISKLNFGKQNIHTKKVNEPSKVPMTPPSRNLSSKLILPRQSQVLLKTPVKKDVGEVKSTIKSCIIPKKSSPPTMTTTASTASRPQIIRTGRLTKNSPSMESKIPLPSSKTPILQPRMTRATLLAKKAKEEALIKNQKKDKWI
ncbi:Formin, FH2 domain-containing protein [Strongyloides ratti]|uniref:Formin, FH2 domain-containing protein n=1 Tax=Strongyloides ratti TaxID=34506 RepID=A0A090L7Z6_STRRB|nr:Formin, FH2 domain-containing protein [Strongyloides ratti]CEF65867.1 Formin, FH2 domain-containing protein [Strongyloides ratti]